MLILVETVMEVKRKILSQHFMNTQSPVIVCAILQFALTVLRITLKSYCLGLNTPLNVTNHLRPLTNVLWDVRPRWYYLGIQLNIDQPTLEVSVFSNPIKIVSLAHSV